MAPSGGHADMTSNAAAPTSSLPATEAPPAADSIIRFRLSDLDTFMSRDSEPYDLRVSPFMTSKGEKLRAVPVLRIFGATDQGQRVVAHVHGAFSYVYIEYKGSLDPDTLNAYILRLGHSLNHALDLTDKRKKRPGDKPQHIAFILPCKATPIYGYQVGYKPYLKIHVVEPRQKKRCSELLRSGAVMRSKFDVFEDHIPFHLQFMLDANLYGCGWVEVSSECKFRAPLPDEAPPSTLYYGRPSCTGPYGTRVYTADTVPAANQHTSSGPPKISHCPLEIDLPLSSILNRRKQTPRDIHHDFVEYLHPDTVEVDKLVKSVKELWVDETRRRVARGEEGPKDVKDTAPREWDKRDQHDPVWAVEPELRRKLAGLADKSKKAFWQKMGSSKSPDFESFVSDVAKMEGTQRGYLQRLRTSFDAVEGLFAATMERDEATRYEYGAWAVRGIGLDVAKEAEEARRREAQAKREQSRSESVMPGGMYDVNETLVQATQARLEARPGGGDGDGGDEDDFDDEREPGDSDDARTERAESEGFGLDQDWNDDEDFDEIELAAGAGAIPDQLQLPASTSSQASMSDLSPPQKKHKPSPPAQAPGAPSSPAQQAVVTEQDFAEADAFAASFRRRPNMPKPASASPAKRAGTGNPFSSPTKLVNVRHASASLPIHVADDLTDEEAVDLPLLSLRDEPGSSPPEPLGPPIRPPAGPSAVESDPMDLEDLSPSAFAGYEPTPTMREDAAAPSTLPHHLRSEASLEHVASGSTASSALPPSLPSFGNLSQDSDEPRRTVHFETDARMSSAHSDSADEDEQAVTGLEAAGISSSLDASSRPFDTLRASQHSDSAGPESSGPITPKAKFPLSKHCYAWAIAPPTTKELVDTMERWGQPRVVYKDAYYSNPADVTGKLDSDKKAIRWEYGGRTFVLTDDAIRNTPPFHHGLVASADDAPATTSARCHFRKKWEYALRPPSSRAMREWIDSNDTDDGKLKAHEQLRAMRGGQIEGPTQKHGGFKFTAIQGAPSQKEPQHMAVLSMELHVNTRGKLLPNPEQDAIEALFYCLKSENEDVVMNGRLSDTHVGVIAVGTTDLLRLVGKTDYVVEVVDTEHDLMNRFIDLVRDKWDPEAVAGYEVHHASWGYLLERAEAAHDWKLVHELGRVTQHDTGRHGTAKTDRWGFNQATTLNFTGRHVLPIWRILKADNRMQHNNFEHVAFHVLQQRTPHFSFETLTRWYTSGVPHQVARVFQYWRNRVEMDVEMLDKAEIIEQNCESARVFGVDFRSVRVRGSQFKVESVLFKLSKPESLMMLSPNRVDVGRQNAAECQPLIMEPQSAFYKGPVVVLDFQSLYPSVMIAHNYCYSTCLGRVEPFRGTAKFGTTELEHPPGLIELLKEHITISPNGMMFVKSRIRKSLVAKMVGELLDTRVMVKSSMKAVEDDKALSKLLNARQLALKFLANVTYGYIGATFSGRMPCVEIADAIVQTGRETLEKALRTIESNREWGAKVVYGDTDSLFIHLPGKSKDDAFRIGHEMANTVTSMNPRPIKLKFEKVYLPSVLLAKKRYVGFKYERPTDAEPEFEAKGIETVRRDGIVALQKMQETCLKILFRTSDLSLVKSYCQRQWSKVLANKASPQDFILAQAVKLGTYAEGRLPPPGAAVAARAMAADPRGEPEFGERVPYILIQSEPGTKQVDKALSPKDFLSDPRIRIDAHHYIVKKMLPPLERIFNLLGADVRSWYADTPKTKLAIKPKDAEGGRRKVIVDEYFTRDRCLACGGPEGNGGLCARCVDRPGEVAYNVLSRLRKVEARTKALMEVCASCSSSREEEGIACDSVDCPVMWDRASTSQERKEILTLSDLVGEHLDC